MVRFTAGAIAESGGLPPATACVGHRCDKHNGLPPTNGNGPDGSECAGCTAEAFTEAFEEAFEGDIFWPTVDSARDRLNMLAPGAGDQFVAETRARIEALKRAGEDES